MYHFDVCRLQEHEKELKDTIAYLPEEAHALGWQVRTGRLAPLSNITHSVTYLLLEAYRASFCCRSLLDCGAGRNVWRIRLLHRVNDAHASIVVATRVCYS